MILRNKDNGLKGIFKENYYYVPDFLNIILQDILGMKVYLIKKSSRLKVMFKKENKNQH